MGTMASDPPLRVLVVDNSEPVCAATTEILNSLGYRANCETDSLNALKVFSANPNEFDLAIIEPMLPDLTGFDLAMRFREIRPSFPVMFYGGYVEKSLSRRIDINSLGPVVFKPCTTVELVTAIKDKLSAPVGGGSCGGGYP